ncbi:MAG: hypothetical protein KDI55_12005, partial [Anaerolineae bacterium]|nr:hypothetical protein [Anaerolineae bacterium]
MKRSLFLAAVLISALLLPGAALAAGSADQATPPNLALDRTIEPVIVAGIFAGKPVDELFVYRWTGSSWEQIPFQIDERNSAGDYVANEDGVMDSNDEVVFMSGDTGMLASDSIGSALPVSGLWYRVEVTNPLNTSSKGWAYIVHSTSLSITNPTDYVSYNNANLRVSTANYALGWAASGHNGLDYMSMYGGGDIMDRTKLRIDYRVVVLQFHLTENDIPFENVVLIKDGAVRTLVKRGGTVTTSYQSYTSTNFPVDLSSLPGNLERFRTSTDLAQGVSGTYYDENNNAGKPIDGVPDNVTQTPFTQAWRQVTVGAGSNIQVAKLTELGGVQKHYYKDNSAVDPQDTGDQRS